MNPPPLIIARIPALDLRIETSKGLDDNFTFVFSTLILRIAQTYKLYDLGNFSLEPHANIPEILTKYST